jgi:hypothetical protein
MSDRTAGFRTPALGSVTQPAIGNIAVADLSAVLGTVAWLALVVAGELGAIERALALAPLVEFVSVSVFTVAVAAFGVTVVRRVAPTCPRPQGVLLGVSAVALPVSMALALSYGVSTFTGRSLGLTVSTMVALHGSFNAFGLGLCAMVGWRLSVQ